MKPNRRRKNRAEIDDIGKQDNNRENQWTQKFVLLKD